MFHVHSVVVRLLQRKLNEDLCRTICREYLVYPRRKYSARSIAKAALLKRFRRLINQFPLNVALTLLMDDNQSLFQLIESRRPHLRYKFQDTFRKQLMLQALMWYLHSS